MKEKHPYHATLPTVPDGVFRPLWSVMIPTYNCAKHLRSTLASVLAQDPGPEVMQIEVIDDCSTLDDPAAVIAELGHGRVKFYRQPQNVGHTKNFQTCLERSRGKLIHLLHGDDCVRDGFYVKMQQGFDTKPEIGAAFCRHIIMDENSHWQYFSRLEQPKSDVLDDWLARIAVEQRIQTPAMVVRREVYEQLGMFDSRLCWAEDWEMWVRIAANYPVWYEVEPLALYRIHSNSSSGNRMRTGENMRDVRRAIEIFKAYLPEKIRYQLVNQSKENWAFDAIRYTVPYLLNVGDTTAAAIQIQEALKCHCSLKVIRELTPLLLLFSKSWLKRKIKKCSIFQAHEVHI